MSSATKSPRSRSLAAVALVVLAGWLLRAWPALSFGDWWRVPVDYDDAVYFTASALFGRGVMPYRDFVLVHPPGLVLFLAPISILDASAGAADAFSLARWVMVLVGATNIALSARLAHRVAGPAAGVAAAAVYAVLPEIVAHERSTYLEPVLNLACLLLASAWLSIGRSERVRRTVLLAGIALGAALAVKAWAAVWAVACLVSLPAPNRSLRWTLPWLAAGAVVALVTFSAPFLIAAPEAFFDQTLAFQLWRPRDGILAASERLIAMLRWCWPVALLAVTGVLGALRHGDESSRRSARFFGAALVLTALAFLLSPVYWPDYNAHLAPALAHLAGLGAAVGWRSAARGRGARFGAAAILIAMLTLPAYRSVVEARVGGDLLERIGAAVRALPTDACYLPFEPAWSLAGDRLPTFRPDRPIVIDVYAAMLIASRGVGREHTLAGDALRSRAAQDRIRELIAGCGYLSLGERGERQLTPHTRQWIERRWERVAAPSDTDFDLWRQRP